MNVLLKSFLFESQTIGFHPQTQRLQPVNETSSFFPGGLETRGRDSEYNRGGDARRLAYGCKFRILVSLRVFWGKTPLYLAVKVSFRVAHEKIYKHVYCLCFNMVSFRGQKKLGLRPDRSLLGV